MTRKLLAFVLFSALCLPGTALTQTAQVDQLATGIRLIEEGDLEAAMAALEGAVQELEARPDAQTDLARAHVYLGMVCLALDQPERARTEMQAAWTVDDDMELDPSRFSLRVRRLYQEVKDDAEAQQKQTELTTPLPAPETASPTPGATDAPAGLDIPTGARVRVSAPSVSGQPVVGTVTSFDGTTLVLDGEEAGAVTIPLSRAATVEISEGRPSKTRRVLSWGVGGLLAGGALGAVYGNGESTQVDQTCLSDAAFFGFPQSECERSEKRGTGKWAGIGGGVGAVLGALLGSVTGGETWTPVQGLEVGLSVRHQGVQVSLRF